MHRGYRFRLYPTEQQAKTLAQYAGAVRFVYNLALEQRRDWWRQHLANTGRRLNWAAQSREVTALRAEVDWIAATPRAALEQALRDLDAAYSAFFAGRSGYPNPRKRGINDSFRIPAKETRVDQVSRKWGGVRVPSLGVVRFRTSRELAGKLVNATFSRDGDHWFVTLAAEAPQMEGAAAAEIVGIDRGVTIGIALSNGETRCLPIALARIEQRKGKAQRILARRTRGSRRRERQRLRVARLLRRARNIRSDWAHKASTDVARRFGTVCIEALNIRAMTSSAAGTAAEPGRNVRQKAGLNRAILNVAWGAFERNLAYKLAERGGKLIKVNPAYTSQTCSACGVVDAASRKSQASFACTDCGFTANADHNAAINILRRGTSWLDVEAQHWRACEASTEQAAA